MDRNSVEGGQVAQKSGRVTPMLGVERAAGAPLSVLVADGEEMVQRVLRATLERRGWFVCRANDGREALDFLQAEHFDLVLLDLNLAFINGFEVLGALGQMPANGRARAVVMSAQTQSAPVVRAFELGADDFVHKPLVPEILIARIDRLVQRA